MATEHKSNRENVVFVLTGIIYQPVIVLRKLQTLSVSGWFFFLKYGLIFTLFASLARAITRNEKEDFGFYSLFVQTLKYLFSFWVSLFGGAALVAQLAFKFGAFTSFSKVFLSVTIAYLPLLLSFLVAAWIPVIHNFWIAGLIYTMILFWKSADVLLGIPKDRLTGFTLVAFFIFLGLGYFSAIYFDLITFAALVKI